MKTTLRLLIVAAVMISAQVSFAGSDPNLAQGQTPPCKFKVGGDRAANTNPAPTVTQPSSSNGSAA